MFQTSVVGVDCWYSPRRNSYFCPLLRPSLDQTMFQTSVVGVDCWYLPAVTSQRMFSLSLWMVTILHPCTSDFPLYSEQTDNQHQQQFSIVYQSRIGGCLVTSGRCQPSAAKEEWYSLKRPSSTVAVLQQKVIYM